MFCSECGNQIPDNAKFCPKCGNKIKADPDMEQFLQDEAVNGGIAAGNSSYGQNDWQVDNAAVKNDYSKLGGWLLFFFVICILDAIGGVCGSIRYFSMASLYSSYGLTGLQTLFMFIGIMMIPLAIAEIVFVIHLYQRKSDFLKIFQIMKGVAAVLYLIMSIWGISLMSSLGVLAMGIGAFVFIWGILASVGGACLMTLYYCRSIRVRTYMGSDEYMQMALFRFR